MLFKHKTNDTPACRLTATLSLKNGLVDINYYKLVLALLIFMIVSGGFILYSPEHAHYAILLISLVLISYGIKSLLPYYEVKKWIKGTATINLTRTLGALSYEFVRQFILGHRLSEVIHDKANSITEVKLLDRRYSRLRGRDTFFDA